MAPFFRPFLLAFAQFHNHYRFGRFTRFTQAVPDCARDVFKVISLEARVQTCILCVPTATKKPQRSLICQWHGHCSEKKRRGMFCTGCHLFISSMKIRCFAVWTLQPLSLDAGLYSCVHHAGHARQSTLGSLWLSPLCLTCALLTSAAATEGRQGLIKHKEGWICTCCLCLGAVWLRGVIIGYRAFHLYGMALNVDQLSGF